MPRLKKIIVIATLANFVAMTLVYLHLPGTGTTIIQLQFAFSPERAQVILDLWGQAGQDLFTQTLYLDYLFPLLYGTFLFLISHFRIGKSAAIASALFDMIENSLHFAIIKGYCSMALIPLASINATLKWLSILFVLGCFFYTKKKYPSKSA